MRELLDVQSAAEEEETEERLWAYIEGGDEETAVK